MPSAPVVQRLLCCPVCASYNLTTTADTVAVPGLQEGATELYTSLAVLALMRANWQDALETPVERTNHLHEAFKQLGCELSHERDVRVYPDDDTERDNKATLKALRHRVSRLPREPLHIGRLLLAALRQKDAFIRGAAQCLTSDQGDEAMQHIHRQTWTDRARDK